MGRWSHAIRVMSFVLILLVVPVLCNSGDKSHRQKTRMFIAKDQVHTQIKMLKHRKQQLERQLERLSVDDKIQELEQKQQDLQSDLRIAQQKFHP